MMTGVLKKNDGMVWSSLTSDTETGGWAENRNTSTGPSNSDSFHKCSNREASGAEADSLPREWQRQVMFSFFQLGA